MAGSIDYLLGSLVVISMLFAGACLLAWRLFERPRHALMWGVAYVIVGLQYSVNLLRDALPGEGMYWQLANMLAVAAVLFAVWGHRERLRLYTSLNTLSALFLGLALTSLAVLYLLPGSALRAALVPAFVCLSMTHITWVLLRRSRQPGPAEWVAAGSHQLFGLNQGLAALVALAISPGAGDNAIQLYHVVNFALMPILFVAMGLSVIFLLGSDLTRRLKVMALRDPLTGLYNRRGYLAATEGSWAVCREQGQPLTVIMLDIDLFKRVNDRYGHGAGDEALRHFAHTLRDCLRVEEDTLGRMGGEEFAVTLAGLDAGEAAVVADRVRECLRDSPLVVGGEQIELRASFGIAQWREMDDIPSLLKRADVALYKAKAAGRDRVMVSESPGLVGMVSNG